MFVDNNSLYNPITCQRSLGWESAGLKIQLSTIAAAIILTIVGPNPTVGTFPFFIVLNALIRIYDENGEIIRTFRKKFI